jgi:hypothetical protein
MITISACDVEPQDVEEDLSFRYGEWGIATNCALCGAGVIGFRIIAQPGMFEMHCQSCGYHTDSVFDRYWLTEEALEVRQRFSQV